MGALFALANAVLISTVAVAIRKMSVTESTETLHRLSADLALAADGAAAAAGFFLADAPPTCFFLATAGIVNGVAQYWWTKSLHLAPTSAVVPFNYLSLVWASIAGFWVWGEVPTPGLVAGSAVVVGSGLYILWRETGARARAARARG